MSRHCCKGIKVVHVTPDSPYHGSYGGVKTLVRDLARDLAKKGYLVKVFCLENSSSLQREEIIEGVIVRRFKRLVGDPLYVPSLKFINELHKEGPDIIHVHNIHTLLPAFIAIWRKYFSGKVVLQPHYHRYGQNTIRNFLFFTYKVILSARLLQHFDVIIANSEYEATCLREDFPKISSKIVLVPEDSMITLPSVKWRPSVQPKKVLYVGALKKYKNVDVLIHAFKILNLKRNDSELVLIGNGPERKRLLNLAFKLGVHRRVIWKRNLSRDELLEEMSRASVVVLLSKLESFSRVAHEAIAIGTPLLVYNYGVFRDLVRRGLAKGVDKLDPEEVASAINSVLNGEWRPKIKYDSGKVSYVDLITKVYEAVMERSALL